MDSSVRKAISEKDEDEIDAIALEKAIAEFKKDPTTYTHEEIKKELGFL